MSQANTAIASASVWAGGRSPYAVNSKKFGMWLFVISDALTFSALLMAYTYVRLSTPNWPTPFHFFPSIVFSSVMTFCLLSSSLTMVMAVHSMNHNNRKATVRWILATLFGGTFFALTGLHMTHVVLGLIYLGIMAFAVGRGKFKAIDVEVSGLYWHFVDLVWMFIFPMVYLLSAKL